MRITATNRGPDAAPLHILPHVWFRNIWSWDQDAARPEMKADGAGRIALSHRQAGDWHWACDADAPLLFCENETNGARLFGQAGADFPKDGINDAVVHGAATVNPAQRGTKAAAHVVMTLAPGETRLVRVRLSAQRLAQPFADFDAVFVARRAEADAFFEKVAIISKSALL